MPYSGQVFIVTKKEYVDLKLLYSCNSIFSLFVMGRWEIYFVYVFFSKVLAVKVRGPQAAKKGLKFLLFSLFMCLFI